MPSYSKTPAKLAYEDIVKMNHMGRKAVRDWIDSAPTAERYKRVFSESSIEEAAEYLAMAQSNTEYMTLYFEFLEGARNSDIRQYDLDFLKEKLKDRAAAISARP